MKTRKAMSHTELMKEAIDELKKRFKPKVSAIKVRDVFRCTNREKLTGVVL